MTETFLKTFEDRWSAGSVPGWIQEVRRQAIDRFASLGLPKTDMEEWRYTNVDSLAKTQFLVPKRMAPGGVIENDFIERSDFYHADDLRLVFVNGLFAPLLSHTESLPKGVFCGNLGSFLKEHPGVIEKHLSRLSDFKDRTFVALNTAFLEDAAIVYLPKGVVCDKPIYLCHLSWTSGLPTVTHPRNLIIAEEGSQATLVEIYAGGGDETYFTNAVTEIVAGEGSVMDHYKLQQEGGNATHIASTDVVQARDSRLQTFSALLGSSLCRNEVKTLLQDEGANCTLNGFYMVTGRQHVDNQTTIDHAKPHGTSAELYKGILGGQSRGVFNGRIIVRPDAQKTVARQTNKNLILSKDALVNTKPLLEIFANDVKCNHGATIGRLDENQVFYLRSRGLAEAHARNLLTYAFASDLLSEIKVPRLQSALEKWVFRRLLAGEIEGGVRGTVTGGSQ